MKRWIFLAILLMSTNWCLAKSVTVSWDSNSETDLKGYEIYYGDSTGVYSTVITVGKITEYEITGLDENKTYYFALKAFDTALNKSDFSTEVMFKFENVKPSPPSGVTVTDKIIIININ